MGRASVLEVATEEKLCSDPACADGIATIYGFARDYYGVDGPLLDWCLGVDHWAEARVRRGGMFKEAAVWVMYLPCGALTEAKA